MADLKARASPAALPLQDIPLPSPHPAPVVPRAKSRPPKFREREEYQKKREAAPLEQRE